MSKQSFISRHIVLYNNTTPTYGVVKVYNSFVSEVVLEDESTTVEELMAKHADWNPLNFEDYYISPGIVDFVRQEFEDTEVLTRRALSGGVTFLAVETSHYNPTGPDENTGYCDFGYVRVVGDSIDRYQSAIALKGYLSKPSQAIPSIQDLSSFIEHARNLRLPILIDAAIASQRQLSFASPYRLETLETRNQSSSKVLDSNAFPDEVNISDSDSESHGSSTSGPNKTESSFSDIDLEKEGCGRSSSEINLKRSWNLELETNFSTIYEESDEQSPASPVFRKPRKRANTHTIFDDLHHRIKKSESMNENLSVAESKTYERAGSTTFVPKPRSISFDITELERSVDSELESSPSESPPKRPKPPPLNIIKEEPPRRNSTLYVTHLANFPDSWELTGINFVTSAIHKEDPPVHFTNLSSAGSFDKLQKAKKKHLKVTCDISALQLVYSSDDVAEGNTRFKMSPPIRSAKNNSLCWELLKFKVIDAVFSHHASISPEFKYLEEGNFKKALNGVDSLGFNLQSLWKILCEQSHTSREAEHYLVRLGKWLSLKPAQVLNLPDRGAIQPNMKADLVIWKPYETCKVSKAPETSVHLHREVKGQIHYVYLRGKLAYDRGVFYRFGLKESKV